MAEVGVKPSDVDLCIEDAGGLTRDATNDILEAQVHTHTHTHTRTHTHIRASSDEGPSKPALYADASCQWRSVPE